MSEQNSRTMAEWWSELDQDRASLLDRKREHGMLTMPALLPYEGRVGSAPLEVPYNSTAADGINALSSRIGNIIFPLNGQPIFEIGSSTAFDPEGKDDSELNDVLSRFGRYTMKQLAPTNLRAAINLAYNHLTAIGDVLMEMDTKLQTRLYRLDQYVVRRKHEGDWVDIIIREFVLPSFHPALEDMMHLPKDATGFSGTTNAAVGGEDWEPLFTHVHKSVDGAGVTKEQWFRGQQVGKTETTQVSAYFPLRWKAIIGEAYGISLCEDAFGDIRGLDALSKGLLDGVLLGSVHVMGVNPAGLTELQDMLDAINGDVIPAAPKDVFPIQYENAASVAATFQAVKHREETLARKFLKRTQRDAERVTAREIVADATDLESQLGGTLSMAGNELQDPVIRWVLHVLTERKMIPAQILDQITKEGGLVTLAIKAGLEVLQREAEREKLDGAIERMRNLPEQAQDAFIWTAIARDWWQSMGLDAAGRVKTEEQVQQERQAAQQQQMAQQAMMQGMQAKMNAPQESKPE